MGLKQIIKQQKLLASGAVDAELVLPGEPLIYSIKYSIGDRSRSVQFFRNEKWRSLIKCYFASYYRTKIPVVIVVRFYVTPPSNVNIKHSELVKESTPAVHAFELCDYGLSFLEMLHHVLINSYRQVVKIDMEKFYSANPRTVFKFMKWDHYVNLQNNNTVHSKSKRLCENGEVWLLQSELQGDATNERICQEAIEEQKTSATMRSIASDNALPNTSTSKLACKKTRSAKFPTAHKETRRRQSGEISQ